MKTRNFLILFMAVLGLAWAWEALILNPMTGDTIWVVRKQAMYLTGVWSMALMSLVMLLATRPAWLESFFGGMDKVYHLHKWAGIWAISLGIAHWLIKIAKGPLLDIFGAIVNKPTSMALLSILQSSKPLAKDVGEWVVYALIAALVITLWRAFPYKSWRLLHRAMPVLYLALVFHSVVLVPAAWWLAPIGLLMAVLLALGSYGAYSSLFGSNGKNRRYIGQVKSLKSWPNGITEVNCSMPANWPGHEAGQFAFVSFDDGEGAHPFTIANAANSQGRQLSFQIKALGDYTSELANTLHAGQSVTIEGPYGRFDYRNGGHQQAWVAGGIGITPFLAWLEDLQDKPERAPLAQLHYCVRDAGQDPFIRRLEKLCANLPNISLHVYDGSQGQRLDAVNLQGATAQAGFDADRLEVWFCGPEGLAVQLRNGLQHTQLKHFKVHKEVFELR